MDNRENLLQGLQALAKSAFPMACSACGKKYHNFEEFANVTGREACGSGAESLDQNVDDDGVSYLEITRFCVCGKKLKGEFGDRRDNSAAGQRRRNNFSEVMVFLVDKGFDEEEARHQLLRLMRGEKSELLAPYLAANQYHEKAG